MKWLIWGPAIVIILSAFAVPGGLVLFALPLLALGYFVFALIARAGSEEYHAAQERAATEHRQPASFTSTERSSDERAA